MKKKGIITSFFVFCLTFLLCIIAGGSSVRAADCKDNSGKLGLLNGVKCAYANKVSDLSYISDANKTKYTNQFGKDVSLNKEGVTDEGYPAGTKGSMSSNGSPYNTENGYKVWDSNYPDIQYYYGIHDNGKSGLGAGATNIVRGTNAILFPAKYSGKQLYNTKQFYRVCEKKRMWGLFGCKTWSDYKLGKEAYSSATGKYVNGAVEFDNLTNVTMVLPSFQINLSRSDYKYIQSTPVYNMAGFDRRFDLVSALFYIGKDKYTYNASGGIQRVIGDRGTWLDDNAVLHNYYKDQVIFNTLVMEYTTKIYYYYLVGGASACVNGLCKVQKAVANAKLYVVYRVANNSDSGYFAALNGWSEDEGSAATGVSLIPIHYDVSMILDPAQWTAGSCSAADECTEMYLRESVKNAGTVTFSGKDVVKEAIQTDTIYVRAVGLDTDKQVNNTITLDVTGSFKYKHDVELVEGMTIVVTSNGETKTITNEAGKTLTGQVTPLALNRTWGMSSGEIAISFYPGGFEVSDLRVFQVTDPEHIEKIALGGTCNFKYYSSGNKLETQCDGTSHGTSFVKAQTGSSQKAGKDEAGKKVYTFRLSSSTAWIGVVMMEMKASGEQVFVPLGYDPVKPKNVNYDSPLFNGKYVIATSIEDAKNKGCVYEENVAPTSDRCEVILTRNGAANEVNPNQIQFKYKDWVGLVGESPVLDLIVDDKDPDSIQGEIAYELQVEGLDATDGSYSTDLNIPTFNLEFVNFDITLNTINGVFADIENHEDFKSTLSNLGMYEVVLTDPKARGVVTITAYDPGTYGEDSAGIAGFFYKMWNIGEESVTQWSYHQGDTYEITGLKGDTYVAVMSVDNANRLYNPTGGTGVFIRVYKISMYSIPFVNEVIATEQGLAFVVRDDVENYKAAGISTKISKLVAVDTVAGSAMYTTKATSVDLEQDYFKDVLYNPGTYGNTTPITLSNTYQGQTELSRAAISYDDGMGVAEYLNSFSGTFFDYQKLNLSSHIQDKINMSLSLDIDTTTFDNMMLINGLLLNGASQLYIEYTVTEPTRTVVAYQMVSMPTKMVDEAAAKTFSFYNEVTDHEISSMNDVLAITGNDYNSTKNGDDFVLNYRYYTYYSADPIAGALTETADGLYYRITPETGEPYVLYKSFYTCVEKDGKVTCTVNEGQYNIYYKICYETEGTFGDTVSCHGDRYLYTEESGVVLGKINENVVYHVYTAIMTAVVWDSSTNQLVAKYNNDSSDEYRVVTPHESIISTNRVIDGEYEIDYCRFLYATAIPEITVEYVTMNEYNPDGINKLKDPGWVTGSLNYIIKVTLNYEVDKFKRDPDEWMTLTENDIYWFAYYEATGRSVCGNVDRMDCDIKMTSFGLYDASSRSGTYTPRVYYLQYPTTEDINNFNMAYSVDVFDLVIKLQGNNGLTNEGMDLVVDGVTREENKDFLTIYYDQDGPKITITSSPDKDPSYYAIAINAKDVSSNVAKVYFYYGRLSPDEEIDDEAFLLYEEVVNKKEFSGYSAKLTQKGWYTVIAEDEFGQRSYCSFEVVQLNDGVMFSPTLDDTDQIQDNDDDKTTVVVTIIATVVTLLVVLLIIALVIAIAIIYFKYGKAIKMGKKAVKKAKPIAKYTKNAGGWVGAASKVVDAIPDEAVDDTPKEKAEEPQDGGQDDSQDQGGGEE